LIGEGGDFMRTSAGHREGRKEREGAQGKKKGYCDEKRETPEHVRVDHHLL